MESGSVIWIGTRSVAWNVDRCGMWNEVCSVAWNVERCALWNEAGCGL